MKLSVTIKIASALVFASQYYISQSYSPYAYYGIGTMNQFENARNISLGNTGYALDGTTTINTYNPASLGTMSARTALFDVGGRLVYNTVESSSRKDVNFNGNYSNLGAAFSLSPKIGLSINLQSNSSSEYKFLSTIPIEGSHSEYPIQYEGSGGLSNFNLNLGYKINKKWNIGIGGKNYWGTVERKEIVMPASDIYQFEIIRNERYAGFGYNIGTQYNTKLFKDQLQLTLGGVINFKTPISSNGELDYVKDSDYNNIITTTFKGNDTDIPLGKGLGLNLIWKDYYRLVFDYTINDWQKSRNTTTGEKYKQQQIFGLGFERLPTRKFSESIFDYISYRAGLNYDSGNYSINHKNVDKLQASLGIGIPIKNNLTINLNYGYTVKGIQNSIPIKENYHQFNVSINILEFWFNKQVYD